MSTIIKKYSFHFGLGIIVFFCSLYFIRGEGSYLDLNDNLDSNIVWYKTIEAQNAHFWENTKLVEGMIGAQPRHVYPSEFDPILWIYSLLPTYYAFSTNFLLIHLIAFIGMYLLLKEILPSIRNSKYNVFNAVFGALIFALIPFWTHAGISSAGLPLVMLSFVKINNGEHMKGFLLMLFFTLYSSLVLSGLFVLIIYFLVLLVSLFTKKIDGLNFKKHFFNISLSSAVYLLVNYRLIQSVLLNDFTSHRSQFAVDSFSSSFFAALKGNVIKTQWHSGSILPFISIFALVLSIYFLMKRNTQKPLKYILSLYLSIVTVTLIINIEFVSILIKSIPVIGMLQMNRFYFLLPFMTSLCFVILIYKIQVSNKIKSLLLLLIVPLYFVADSNWGGQIRGFIGINRPVSSFSGYYKEDIFAAIKEKIDLNEGERVVSLGINPAKAVFNKIPSADGYLATYDLNNKLQMYTIIEEELKKDSILYNHFVNWGSRCYFFNSDYGKDSYFRPELQNITSFEYNISAMLRNKVTHIISSGLIKSDDQNLSLKFKYEGYYVYNIIP